MLTPPEVAHTGTDIRIIRQTVKKNNSPDVPRSLCLCHRWWERSSSGVREVLSSCVQSPSGHGSVVSATVDSGKRSHRRIMQPSGYPEIGLLCDLHPRWNSVTEQPSWKESTLFFLQFINFIQPG